MERSQGDVMSTDNQVYLREWFDLDVSVFCGRCPAIHEESNNDLDAVAQWLDAKGWVADGSGVWCPDCKGDE